MSSKRGGLASGFAGKQNPANPHTPREWVPRLRRPPHCHGLRGVARRGDAEAGWGRARAGRGRARGSASRGWAGAAAVRLAFPPPRAHGAALNLSGFLLARGPGLGPRPAPRRCRQGVTAIRGSGARMDRGPVEGASWGRTGEAGEAIGHGGCRVCVWGGQTPCRGPSSACRPPRDTREARS